LKDVLSPEAYESWLRLKQKYLRGDDDIEKYRPMVAEEKLVNAIGKKAMKGLKLTPVYAVVNKAAKKHKVPIHQLPTVERKIEIEKPRAILKAARNRDLAEGECVGRNLLRIERSDALGNFAFDVKSVNAWATGDIEALRPKPEGNEDLQREDCITASLIAMANDPDAGLSPEMSRGIDLVKQQEELHKLAGEEAYLNWMAAAEAALTRNTSTFAVLPMSIVLSPNDSWLAKLAEKGFVVEPPRG
jgi:hypothetical protein